MNDDLWESVGKGRWQYRCHVPGRWFNDYADIQVRKRGEWHLFINRTYVATFNSWAEARDATPMMIKLHGYESQS